jgi:hypothetical protein
MHAVLEPRYLKRNPHLAFSATVEDVSPAGSDAAVWPISGDTTTASFIPSLMSTPHAGTFTAASGVHIHRGDALPASHRDSIFICESAQNLVQRQVRSSNGVTFTSQPAQTGRDFLASRDTWFRPVFAANGPDGALYIVDITARSSTTRSTFPNRVARCSISMPERNGAGSIGSSHGTGRRIGNRLTWGG